MIGPSPAAADGIISAMNSASTRELRWYRSRPAAHDCRVGRLSLSPATIVVGITLIAAVLRIATIDVQSIWADEGATIRLVHRGFGGMLSHLSSSESTPPLYYVLVWAWTRIFGTGPIGFRSFSVLIGTAFIPVVYAAGCRMSLRAGLWAALLAALSPIMLYYSQEARAYGLLILLSGAAFVQWLRVLEDGAAALWWRGRLCPPSRCCPTTSRSFP